MLLCFRLMQILKEACVETLAETKQAAQKGAHRIELCGDLSVGGVTPDFGLIEKVLREVDLPVKVMIRPRGGDFVYSERELEQMKKSIRRCKEIGVKEIVCGILLPDGTIDIARLQSLAYEAAPMQICIHKAIDETPDPVREIERLKAIPQVISILTSGKAATAEEGIPVLKQLLRTCGDRLQLIVAGKVTDENLLALHAEIGAAAYHGRKIVGKLNPA